MGLCEAALVVADKTLVPGGSFVCKIFQGSDFKAFTDAVKQRFHRQVSFRPQSTRKASREMFVIGLGKKIEGEKNVRTQ
jgi:23S rRNA (uridine2552-2'-O)-methyltransferase